MMLIDRIDTVATHCMLQESGCWIPLAWKTVLVLAILLPLQISQSATALTVDFDDLTLPTESYWNGPDPQGETSGSEILGTFSSYGTSFINRFHLTFGSWSGFAYSNTSNTTTSGFTNQFSAFTGTGLGAGADNYGVAFGHLDLEPNLFQTFAFDPNNPEHLQQLPFFEVSEGARASSVYVTNTTYAALSMLQGDDGFTKQFGGPSGNDPDWFKLDIYGTDDSGDPLPNSVEFYLADYRAADPNSDYIVDEWALVDLSALADAQRVYFNLSSSDVGLYGMNTPAYVAIDNLVLDVPVTPGDFDLNGTVDHLDLEIWEQHYGTALGAGVTTGDADEDGDVDGVDLLAWQLNFSPPQPLSVAVPEPSAALMILSWSIFFCCLRQFFCFVDDTL